MNHFLAITDHPTDWLRHALDVAKRILEQPDPPAIILVSSREAVDYGPSIDRSGAQGFISKTELSAGALAAILEDRP